MPGRKQSRRVMTTNKAVFWVFIFRSVEAGAEGSRDVC